MKKSNRYSREQMFSLIRKWEASGQSQAKFFEEQRICKSTFGYWRKKYLHDQPQTKTSSSRLIPVQIEPGASPLTESNNLEIIYPNGVRIILSGQMDAKQIKELIH